MCRIGRDALPDLDTGDTGKSLTEKVKNIFFNVKIAMTDIWLFFADDSRYNLNDHGLMFGEINLKIARFPAISKVLFLLK